MIDFLRKFNTLTGLKKDFRGLLNILLKIRRKKLIREYLKKHTLYKLHLGSNNAVIDGWLCSDIRPLTSNCIYLDATRRFPFKSDTFDYIYSEHMIEHLSLEEGFFMFKECHRVLKNNGKIRIATPDLRVIIDTYLNRNDPQCLKYNRWISENFIKGICFRKEDSAIVLNSMFHNWKHKFLFDKETLLLLFEETGFHQLKEYPLDSSDDIHFKKMERHHINTGNKEMVEYETMIFEAEKITQVK